MFAIAFDMVVADILRHHPRGVPQAYREIGLANLLAAILALKALPWLPACVRDIRGFKVEHWSDFTPIVKGP
jgi:virulence-associated protein VapD